MDRFSYIIEDIDLEELLIDFIYSGTNKIKKFKRRRFNSFIEEKFDTDDRLEINLDYLELSLRLLNIYVNLNIIEKKEVNTIYDIPRHEYIINKNFRNLI